MACQLEDSCPVDLGYFCTCYLGDLHQSFALLSSPKKIKKIVFQPSSTDSVHRSTVLMSDRGTVTHLSHSQAGVFCRHSTTCQGLKYSGIERSGYISKRVELTESFSRGQISSPNPFDHANMRLNGPRTRNSSCRRRKMRLIHQTSCSCP